MLSPSLVDRPPESRPRTVSGGTLRHHMRKKRKGGIRLPKKPLVSYGDAPLPSKPWPPPMPLEGGNSFFSATSAISEVDRPSTSVDFSTASQQQQQHMPLLSSTAVVSSQSSQSARAAKSHVPAGYTTIFSSPRDYCRRLMTNAERLELRLRGDRLDGLCSGLALLRLEHANRARVGCAALVVGEVEKGNERKLVAKWQRAREHDGVGVEIAWQVEHLGWQQPRPPGVQTITISQDAFRPEDFRGALTAQARRLRRMANV